MDVTEEQRGVKRATTPDAPTSSSSAPVRPPLPPRGAPLRFLKHMPLLLPFITDLFQLMRPLGSGDRSIVYEGAVLMSSATEALPPWMRESGKLYAVKVIDSDLTKPGATTVETLVNLYLAQSSEIPTENVVRAVYWTRAINNTTPQALLDKEITLPNRMAELLVMSVYDGGTLERLITDKEHPFYNSSRTNAKICLPAIAAQCLAGLASIAFVISGFTHGDYHPRNFLLKKTSPRCFVYVLGNGKVVLAPTWFTNDCVIALGDFSESSGVVPTMEGDHIIGRRKPSDTPDIVVFVNSITKHYKEIVPPYTDLVQRTYGELVRALPAELQGDADVIQRRYKTMGSLYNWHLDAEMQPGTQTNRYKTAEALERYLGKLPATSALASVLPQLRSLRESFDALAKVYALKDYDDPLEMLRNPELFTQVNDDEASIRMHIAANFALPGVELVRVGLTPPTGAAKPEYVRGRIERK